MNGDVQKTMYRTRGVIRTWIGNGNGGVYTHADKLFYNYLVQCAQFPLSPMGCQGWHIQIFKHVLIPGVSGPLLLRHPTCKLLNTLKSSDNLEPIRILQAYSMQMRPHINCKMKFADSVSASMFVNLLWK